MKQNIFGRLIQLFKQKKQFSLPKERYFLIIGNYINYPMGCCTLQGIKDIHEEEPNAKFCEVTKEEYENFDEQEYAEDIDWLSISKSYDEIKEEIF